jgi:hypothetical protein
MGHEIFSPYQLKQAHVLSENIQRFIDYVGVKNVGFLTLTFPDNVRENDIASRKFNSMRVNFLSKHFGSWLCVKERQRRGAWHYHLLVEILTECDENIFDGFNFDAVKLRDYSSVSNLLKSIWKLLRDELPKYGFGRSELLPIRTTSIQVGRYMGKYLLKHVAHRTKEDKGVRIVSYSQDFLRSSSKFSWNTEGAKEWRSKLQKMVEIVLCGHSMEKMKTIFGPKWAFFMADSIFSVDQIIDSFYSEYEDAPF